MVTRDFGGSQVSMFDFLLREPFVMIVLITSTYWVIKYLLWTISNMYIRSLRFFILKKYGYPPAHCDADGDFKNTVEQPSQEKK